MSCEPQLSELNCLRHTQNVVSPPHWQISEFRSRK